MGQQPTPSTSVPLSLIRMGIELKPNAMLWNFPQEYGGNRLPVWHLADVSVLANVRFAPILLQKSKIEQRLKSRESNI
jgi:hypothetical protein